MKKTIVLVLLMLVMAMGVSATKDAAGNTNGNCDMNGDGNVDISDLSMLGHFYTMYENKELCMDWSGDGKVDLSDLADFGQYIMQEGWCNQHLYLPYVDNNFVCDIEPTPQSTSCQCNCLSSSTGGSGVGLYELGGILFGSNSYFQYPNKPKPLPEIFVPRTEMVDKLKTITDMMCMEIYPPNENLFLYNNCVTKYWAVI